VVGGAGDDDITGGGQKDYLAGGDGDDILKGSAGDDVLLGGRGADRLTGGAGKDWFRFESATDSNRDDGVDTITDFGGSASGERIDLAAIDADINTEGNQAFTWIGTNSAFTEQAGQLRVVQTEGKWFVEGDVDGDGVADIVIHVDMGPDYIWNSSDFIV
jgi:Ca2+-binding RTX toxin-like protein